ncbi:MAG: peptide protein [Sediminibacterium sp.]|nr:peptide protein [Sediminibacterium sp.]
MIAIIGLLLSFSTAFAQDADKVTGLYWSPHKDAKIEVYKKGDKYFGKSVWVANPRKDTENPLKTLQSRDVLGIELLTDFSFDKDTYKGGKIYDPESGKTYDCKMTLAGNILKVRGYIGISLFGRTETFERIR